MTTLDYGILRTTCSRCSRVHFPHRRSLAPRSMKHTGLAARPPSRCSAEIAGIAPISKRRGERASNALALALREAAEIAEMPRRPEGPAERAKRAESRFKPKNPRYFRNFRSFA